MRWKNVVVESLAVELPPEIWSSDFIEQKLSALYERLRLPSGRLELMTGIRERRFWDRPIKASEASALAGTKALASAGTSADEVDLLIHSSVCRDRLEPATAAYVHGLLGLSPKAQFFDISNACLGFMNAIAVAASMIDAGQIRRALICSGENGKPLLENTIAKLNENLTLTRNAIKPYFANLTIGAGAVAAVISHVDVARKKLMKVLGGVIETDSKSNKFCEGDSEGDGLVMQTDSEKLLISGISLASRAWKIFKSTMGWNEKTPARVITHQVGTRHSTALFEALGLAREKDWSSFPFLGNVGSVSLPATLALAHQAGAIVPGDKVALLGIGSGLSTMMLGVEF
ncbi:MAG: 3-oxoacyl-ACP synthase III [Opitutales bacterium]|nr:3-oxoacyl-ACP synthase III [Opitutales bacterium]